MKNKNLRIVLKRYPYYKYLTISSIITGLANWGSFIAMLVLLGNITDSGLELGMLWAISGLIPLAFSFYLGALVDKKNFRNVIIVADIIRAFTYLLFILVPILSDPYSWLLFIFIRFVSGVCGQVSSISKQSIIPDIIKDESDLITANSFNYTITSSIRLTGAALGGGLIAYVNLDIIWIIASLSFFVSTILFLKIKITSKKKIEEKGLLNQILAGIKVSKTNKLVAYVLGFSFTSGLIIGSFNLMIQQMSFETYNSGSIGISALYISEGLISVFLGFWVANNSFSFNSIYKYGYFYISSALVWMLFGFTTNLFFGMLILALFAGFGTLVAPLERHILQSSVDASLRGRVFGLMNTGSMIAIQMGALMTGVIIEYISLEMVTVLIGISDLLLGILFFLHMKSSNITFKDIKNITKHL